MATSEVYELNAMAAYISMATKCNGIIEFETWKKAKRTRNRWSKEKSQTPRALWKWDQAIKHFSIKKCVNSPETFPRLTKPTDRQRKESCRRLFHTPPCALMMITEKQHQRHTFVWPKREVLSPSIG